MKRVFSRLAAGLLDGLRGIGRFVAKLWKHPKGRIGLLIAGLLVILAVFAPLIAPYDPYDVTQRAEKGISFAFQQPVRFKGLTVKDLITLASGKQIGVPEACGYLSEVGLCAKDYIDREVDASLSGGELKRIEIAMIMARGTKLSVFDEPEAGIDLWSFSNLIQVFEHLHEKINGSIIIISHQERILDIADRIIVLADGRIQTQGTRDEVLPQLLGEVPGVCSALSEKVR